MTLKNSTEKWKTRSNTILPTLLSESENIETPDDGEDDSVEYAEHEVIAGELENEDDGSPQ